MKIIFPALVLLMTSAQCFAVDNSNNEKNHVLGIQLGFTSVNSEITSERSDGGTVAGINYGYQFNPTWAINAGVLFGDSLCLITCPQDMSTIRTMDYDSYLLTIKGSVPISKRWSVFGKLGANSYNLEFSGDDRASLLNNGVGGVLAAGFNFRAYNGFGLDIEVTLLDMDIVSATSTTVNVSYMF